MPYNPEIHKRKSIRLKGYDYSQAGLYFVTICVKDRECLFGKIENGEMVLNGAGIIADKFWVKIPEHYSQVELHEHIVMPNHLHGIIELTRNDVGTRHGVSLPDNTNDIVGTSHGMSLHHHQQSHERKFSKPISGSVSMVINQYKSSVKRWCNKNGNENFQWQSRFHDHIIRSADDYHKISNYIMNNPAKWPDNKFYV